MHRAVNDSGSAHREHHSRLKRKQTQTRKGNATETLRSRPIPQLTLQLQFKRVRSSSLDVRSGASFFQLLLDTVGVGLRNAFLHNGRHAFDQVLRFLQTETGDFADDLDDANLVGAETG